MNRWAIHLVITKRCEFRLVLSFNPYWPHHTHVAKQMTLAVESNHLLLYNTLRVRKFVRTPILAKFPGALIRSPIQTGIGGEGSLIKFTEIAEKSWGHTHTIIYPDEYILHLTTYQRLHKSTSHVPSSGWCPRLRSADPIASKVKAHTKEASDITPCAAKSARYDFKRDQQWLASPKRRHFGRHVHGFMGHLGTVQLKRFN